MNETKIMSNKDRRYNELHTGMTLRKKLINMSVDNDDTKIVVVHNEVITGIGTANNLLHNSSLSFMKLLKLDIKDTLKGVSLYLTV